MIVRLRYQTIHHNSMVHYWDGYLFILCFIVVFITIQSCIVEHWRNNTEMNCFWTIKKTRKVCSKRVNSLIVWAKRLFSIFVSQTQVGSLRCELLESGGVRRPDIKSLKEEEGSTGRKKCIYLTIESQGNTSDKPYSLLYPNQKLS